MLVSRDDNLGLAILYRQCRLLMLTRRPDEEFAHVERELLDPRISWQAEVHLASVAPDRWAARFLTVPPEGASRRQSERSASEVAERLAQQAHQLSLDGDDEEAVSRASGPIADESQASIGADVPLEAALVLRLHQLEGPWRESELEHVFNVIHAELIGCEAVTVTNHPVPTGRYYEITASAAAAGQLVRHGARFNGLDLRYDRRRVLSLDAHDID